MSLNELKIQAFTEPVSDLPDNPSQSGITAEELKRKFDANSYELKDAINNIIDYLITLTGDDTIKGFKVVGGELRYTTNGLSYTDTGYTKTEVDDLLSDKANKSSVLTKTNTTSYTPTNNYHPATKKYVDDKVFDAGAADMRAAVYDPREKKKDIFGEIEKCLPLTGAILDEDMTLEGTVIVNGNAEIDRVNINGQLRLENNSELMFYAETGDNAQISKDTYYGEEDFGLAFTDNSGLNAATLRVCASEAQVIAETTNLNVKAKYPHFFLTNEGYNRNLDVFFMTGTGAPDGGIVAFRNALNGDNSTTLYFHPEFTTALNNLLRCQIKIDGRSTYSNIFGQHNKPSNKYTGNGSSTAREIAIGGIGNAVMITSVNGMCIVTAAGAICKTTTGTSVSGLGDTSIKFVDGVLTIATTNASVNSANVDYNYQLL